jgi:hypothetical protein
MKMPADTKVPVNNSVSPDRDYLDEVLGGVAVAQQQQGMLKSRANASISPVVESSVAKSNDKVIVPSDFFTDDIMKQAFAEAEDMMVKGGGNIESDPFFGKIKQDPAYREIAMKKIQNQLNKVAIDQIIANAIKNAPKTN